MLLLTFYDNISDPVWTEVGDIQLPERSFAFEVRHPGDWTPHRGRPEVVVFTWIESITGPTGNRFGVKYWWKPIHWDPYLMTISLKTKVAVLGRLQAEVTFTSVLARYRPVSKISHLFPGQGQTGVVAFQ